MPRNGSLCVYIGLTLALFAGVALVPPGLVLGRSVWVDGRFTIAAYREVLAEGRQWSLLRNTLAIAGGTAFFATVLGVVAGYAVACAGRRMRRTLVCALAVPFLIPPYIATVAWVDLLGRRGYAAKLLELSYGDGASPPNLYAVSGVIFVFSLVYYPLVAFATFLALRGFDRRFEEAGLCVAGKGRVFRRITLPLVGPTILTGTLFVFMLALVSFSTPSLLQVNVYPAEIYSRFSAFNDFSGATAHAIPLVFCGVAALTAWGLYMRQSRPWLTGAHRPRNAAGRRSGHGAAALVFTWFLVAISTALPLGALIRRAMPARSFFEALRTAKEEITTTVILASAAATLVTALAFSMAYLERLRLLDSATRTGAGGLRGAQRGSGGALHRIFALSAVPFLISGPVLGIGLILTWNRPGLPALVYDTLLVVVLACVGRYLFFAHRGAGACLTALDPALEEAASVGGVGWRRRVTGIILPLLWPSLVAVWGLTFVLSVGELEATVLVCPPGQTPLSVRILTLMHYGPSRLVSALSLITVLLILAGAIVTLVIYGYARRRVHVRG